MAANLDIRAVIFDFGSVLVQMGDEAPRTALAGQLGVPLKELYRLVFDSETAVRAMVGELTITQHWQAVGAALGVAESEMPGILAQFWSGDMVNQELVAVIRSLRQKYKVGLLSNAWGDLRQVLETRLPIGHLFDDLVISAEVGMGKPDPRIYRLAIERLSVLPGQAVFVDDVLVNVEAAREVGLKAIHYQDNYQLFSDLRSYNILYDHPLALPGQGAADRL
jgi:epoxide hydrolase-like predicted phosphatase